MEFKLRKSVQLLRASLLLFVVSSAALAGISVNPKYIFLDASKRSVPVIVSNVGDDEAEIWIGVKYGYESSDDTGRVFIFLDTLATGEPSAAGWIKAYPQRFILGAGETQIVRVVALAPPGLREGEYWARISISGKPRKPTIMAKGPKLGTGMVLVTQIGLPFHYRVGHVSTGVELSGFKTDVTGQLATVYMKLTRTGNASFWGTRLFRLIDESGKVVYTSTKELTVYKTMLLREKIDRKNIPSGKYQVRVDFVTAKRKDLDNAILVQASPLQTSNPLIIP